MTNDQQIFYVKSDRIQFQLSSLVLNRFHASIFSLYSNICQRLFASYSLEQEVRSSETKHGEKNIVVLALLCWLFMERIHPSFCALRAGAMRVGILGTEGSKRGNNPPPFPPNVDDEDCQCLWL